MLDEFLRPDILGVMIPIIAILATFTWLITRSHNRHRERMAMIEQGMHPDRPELSPGEAEDRDRDLGSERDLIER